MVKAGKIGNSQSVAIKLVHRRLVSTDGAAWWRECEILTRVRHPNCVAFYGFSYDDTFFMFIQELCSGGNLKGACSTSPETVEGRAIEFMLQIASGVEYLHNRLEGKETTTLYDAILEGNRIGLASESKPTS